MTSKKLRLQIVTGLLLIIFIIIFYYPFPDPNTAFYMQTFMIIGILIASFMFVMGNSLQTPNRATIEDIDDLFHRDSGQILLLQATMDNSHNFLRLQLDRQYIEITNDKKPLIMSRQSLKQGMRYGIVIAPIVSFGLLWLNPNIRGDDKIFLYYIFGVITIAMVIFVGLMYNFIATEMNTFEEEQFLTIRKGDRRVEFTSFANKKELRKQGIMQMPKIAVPVDDLEQDLLITKIIDETYDERKLTRRQRNGYNMITYSQYTNCIVIDLGNENVKILNKNTSQDKLSLPNSSQYPIFAFQKEKILETLLSNIIKWARY